MAATASPWAGYQLSAFELEAFNRAAALASPAAYLPDLERCAHAFGFIAGTILHMAFLAEHVAGGRLSSLDVTEIADARSLAACETADAIAAWMVAHSIQSAHDLPRVREMAWVTGVATIGSHLRVLRTILDYWLAH